MAPRTVVLTFDNLGEAAGLERGTRARPAGDHPSVTTVLPRLLRALAGAGRLRVSAGGALAEELRAG